MSNLRGESIGVQEAGRGHATVETARALSEAREVLQGYEASALAGVAETLAGVAESLERTSRELRESGQDEWMDVEETAAYLKRNPKTFRNIVVSEDVPRHYLTERGVLFSRREIDEWLMGR